MFVELLQKKKKIVWLQANAHKFQLMCVNSHVKDKWITHNFKVSIMVHQCRIEPKCETPIELKKHILTVLNNSFSLTIYTENKQNPNKYTTESS